MRQQSAAEEQKLKLHVSEKRKHSLLRQKGNPRNEETYEKIEEKLK